MSKILRKNKRCKL